MNNYKTFESHDLYDVYTCDTANNTEAIIYCHGGAFRYGNKNDNQQFLSILSNKMSMRVYSVEYRNIDEARSLMNMIDDIRISIDSIVKNDSVSRFHIMGASSGAYLVWILSLMISNPSTFNISFDFEVISVTLISGYLIFKDNDPITRMLCLFPAFQRFPQTIKNIDMDYSGYNIPPLLLISGEDDDCLEDSEVLNSAIRKLNNTKISMKIMNSELDKANHCFLIENPETNISEQAFESMRVFIK